MGVLPNKPARNSSKRFEEGYALCRDMPTCIKTAFGHRAGEAAKRWV
jgi:hypothetical protein